MNRQVMDLARPYGGAGQPAEDGQALQVLVVENHTAAADDLTQELHRHGYVARSVSTGVEALRAQSGVDMVLLDLGLPDLDGLEVCRRIRAAGDVPVICTTASRAELDCVLALQAGADDCLVKPYGLRELLARMEAVLRRVMPEPRSARVLTHGPLRIDTGARELRVAGRRVDLTPKEFDLLYQLASQPGATLSRRQLLSRVWDDEWSSRGRTIDTHVSSLRNKLGSSRWIVTVRGVGFRIGEASADLPAHA